MKTLKFFLFMSLLFFIITLVLVIQFTINKGEVFYSLVNGHNIISALGHSFLKVNLAYFMLAIINYFLYLYFLDREIIERRLQGWTK